MAHDQDLIVDSSVAIDYCESDLSVLGLFSRRVCRVHIVTTTIDEIQGFDDEDFARVGFIVDEPELATLFAAEGRGKGLSFPDWVCVLEAVAKGYGCLTSDGRMRRVCSSEGVPVRWGLEPLVEMVGSGVIGAMEAERVARLIHASNPRYITEKILTEFLTKIGVVCWSL